MRPSSYRLETVVAERNMGRRHLRILIVDDHPLVVEALADCIRTINPAADVVRTTSFEEAMEFASRQTFDLALLDYRIPGVQGLQGLRLMHGRFPEMRIVMVSGVAGGHKILEAMEIGAAGFIPKDLSVQALMKALELVLMGESFIPVKALQATGMAETGGHFKLRESPSRGRTVHGLTQRESQVLVLVEQGMPNGKIAEVIGTKYVTVAFHLKNAFRKLGVANRTEAAAAVRLLGLDGESQL
jgi:two-component system, NarL family, nitrate/nitrite response regulator NarL